MAQKTSTQVVQNLVINKVDSKAAFEQMQANNQINANELYLVQEQAESIIVVNFTEDKRSITADKTYAEILEALNNNKPIIGYIHNGIVIPYKVNDLDDDQKISFISQTFGEKGFVFQLDYNSNGTITAQEYPLVTEQTNATLTIGSYTYDGSDNVTIPVYDGTYTWG